MQRVLCLSLTVPLIVYHIVLSYNILYVDEDSDIWKSYSIFKIFYTSVFVDIFTTNVCVDHCHCYCPY